MNAELEVCNKEENTFNYFVFFKFFVSDCLP